VSKKTLGKEASLPSVNKKTLGKEASLPSVNEKHMEKTPYHIMQTACNLII